MTVAKEQDRWRKLFLNQREFTTPNRPGSDQITLRVGWREGGAGRVFSQAEIAAVRITEIRVFGDIAVDSLLISDTLNPIPSLVTVNVASF